MNFDELYNTRVERIDRAWEPIDLAFSGSFNYRVPPRVRSVEAIMYIRTGDRRAQDAYDGNQLNTITFEGLTLSFHITDIDRDIYRMEYVLRCRVTQEEAFTPQPMRYRHTSSYNLVAGDSLHIQVDPNQVFTYVADRTVAAGDIIQIDYMTGPDPRPQFGVWRTTDYAPSTYYGGGTTLSFEVAMEIKAKPKADPCRPQKRKLTLA